MIETVKLFRPGAGILTLSLSNVSNLIVDVSCSFVVSLSFLPQTVTGKAMLAIICLISQVG